MTQANIQEFHKPATLIEAIQLLRRPAPKTMAAGGGTWLLASAPRDLEAVVDLSGLGLGEIAQSGPEWRRGATATLQALIDSPAGRDFCGGVLGEAARAMAGRSLRNRGTLGGCLVTADAVSPFVTALLACDAELTIATLKNEAVDLRRVTARAFLTYRTNLLDEGALITEIRLSLPSADTRAAYERVARTPRDYPIVCAVARCAAKNGILGNVRLALGGLAAHPIRLELAEFALEKKRLSDHLETALEDGLRGVAPAGDWLASAEYRLSMARELVERALRRAADQG